CANSRDLHSFPTRRSSDLAYQSSVNMRKKCSIITVNLNNKDGLQQTIQSVIAQTGDEIEYLVIDGASTDGSVDIIKQYRDNIDRSEEHTSELQSRENLVCR